MLPNMVFKIQTHALYSWVFLGRARPWHARPSMLVLARGLEN
jgi:hypothetical protein